MNYNYFRDYEASTGRYVESDPIGLNGGVSTYGYAAGNPTIAIDPSGLLQFVAQPARWNVNMQPHDFVRAHPGRVYTPWGIGTLAYTTFQWVADAKCQCKPGGYGLGEIAVRIRTVVLAQKSTQTDPQLRSWLRHAEGEHVADFMRGLPAIKDKLSTLEGVARQMTFGTEKECRDSITGMALDALGPGFHTYGGPNQRIY